MSYKTSLKVKIVLLIGCLAQTEVERPEPKTSPFSWAKRATKGSCFLGYKNACLGEDLQRSAGKCF